MDFILFYFILFLDTQHFVEDEGAFFTNKISPFILKLPPILVLFSVHDDRRLCFPRPLPDGLMSTSSLRMAVEREAMGAPESSFSFTDQQKPSDALGSSQPQNIKSISKQNIVKVRLRIPRDEDSQLRRASNKYRWNKR